MTVRAPEFPVILWSAVALAGPALGEAMIYAENSFECTLRVDGTPFGKLPVHAMSITAGSHQFRIDCPDGRTATTTATVEPIAGGAVRVELTGLQYSEPRVEAPIGPVPTYVVMTTIRGQKVRIDGGAPIILPARVNLTVGTHTFTVIDPDGTVHDPQRKDVVSREGQAVVKLD